MSAEIANVRQVQGYCSLCIARCGTVATVVDGRFARLDPDPTHPTGAAICAKGRAAPELVYHKDRLKHPLRRTRPKGDPDPGWEEISWDAALDQTAAAMRRIAEQYGPEAVTMIERGWYDEEFVRAWSNGPLLVRSDTDRLLKAEHLASAGGSGQFVAWDTVSNSVVTYDPAAGRYQAPGGHLALRGEYKVATVDGTVSCRPVFDRYAELCKRYSPEVIEATCWIPPGQLEQAARTIWQSRPVSYYAWSGHEHHANSTETARAMAMLYALTGSFDVAGGNVLFAAVPAASIAGEELLAARRIVPAIGFNERPLGPARFHHVSTRDFYRAVLEGIPYPVRGLIGFGSNLLLAQGDPVRGRTALAALDFYAHADLFMTPTAALADIVLPVASCFEREALKIGFEISEEAQSLVQFRPAIVPPVDQARPDTDFIFDLAQRLGLGEQFWDGDIDAAYREQLDPSGISLEQLRG